MQHVRDILELIHSKNFLKMLNLETLLLLLKIQTFIVVYNVFFYTSLIALIWQSFYLFFYHIN